MGAEPQPPEIPAGRADDLHGLEHARDPDLALFLAGNQFMAVPELLQAFRDLHPDIKKIYCETLPPGLELRQILAGGAYFRDRFIGAKADVYTSVSRDAMQTLIDAGLVAPEGYFPYLGNSLAIMVARGNPKGVGGVADLGRDDLRVSQPYPEYENIAGHILNMYRAAGGEELARKIMDVKRQAGATLPTTVHHRETPERILAGQADAGPVWATEIMNTQSRGQALEGVDIPPELNQRDSIRYYACRLENGSNPSNAGKFLDFLKTEKALEIFLSYGFSK
jgi:hypothetical protein